MQPQQAAAHVALRMTTPRAGGKRNKAYKAACLAAAALLLMALLPATLAAATGKTPIKYGMSGAAVKTLQTHLVKRGYLKTADGKFGRVTQAAVKLFQKHAGLPQDGVAGDSTQKLLYGLVGAGKTNLSMRLGTKSTQVTVLQKRLVALGYLKISAYTTYFGSVTKAAVIKFQKKVKLTADGVAGPYTLVKLYSPNAPKYMTKGQMVVEAAKLYLGCKYVHATAGPTTFDCSGLVYYVYKHHFNITVPRSARDMVNAGVKVEGGLANARPGDILCFGDSISTVGHVAIYVGNNKYIHAPQTGDVVKIEELSDKRIRTCVAVRRVFTSD